jgi:hypothetical protein
MNKILITAVAGILGLGSVAMADRGDRYSRARSDASSRYDRGGSRSDHSDRGSSRGRDYGHRDHGRSRSSFSFGFGASSGGYGDSSFFGLGYSRGYSHGYSHHRYYRAPAYYIAPAPVYVVPPPVIYERRTYYAPTYYGSTYGGYYCR